MIRKLSFAVALTASLSFVTTLIAQETPGFKPTVVQEQVDEGTLVEKASFMMGYTMLKGIQQQGGVVDMSQMSAGMKSADAGEDRANFIAGYNIAMKMKVQGGNLDVDQLMAGIKSAQAGEEKKSFFSGYQMMQQMKTNGIDLKIEKIVEGMNKAIAGEPMGMSQEEMQAIQISFTKMLEKKEIAKKKLQSEENIAATKAYMAKNKAENPDVKELEIGVQYQVLVQGSGPKPTMEDRVKVDYHGTFLDGTVFDSSVKPPNGQPPRPAEMVVAGFVPGFSAVLKNMNVGSKWKVVIPGQLAYGPAGRDEIGPNQALVFELTLLEIVK